MNKITVGYPVSLKEVENDKEGDHKECSELKETISVKVEAVLSFEITQLIFKSFLVPCVIG